MTIKERDELLKEASSWAMEKLLRRIILALPVDEPAKVRCWRHKSGCIGTDRVRWDGTRMWWVDKDGTLWIAPATLKQAEHWEREGDWLPCPDEPAPQPPQPKPSMSQAVRELVRAAEVVLDGTSQADWRANHSKLSMSIEAVRELFVEEQE